MLRAAVRPVLAWVLLGCLVRTVLPEAWLVAWHSHPHTTHEPAVAARRTARGKVWLSTRHQHCHAEQLYQVPFAPAVCVVIPLPAKYRRYQQSRSAGVPPTQAGTVWVLSNRGPPMA